MDTHQRATMTKPMPDVRTGRMLLLPAVLVAVAIVIFAVVWFVTRGGGASVALPSVGTPSAVSEAQLKKLGATTDHPVYWAGKKTGAYELTRTSDGRIYIRYLPSAAKVGDRAPDYLTVGTYPQKNAFASIRRAAARPGAISLKIANGGLMVFNQLAPKSVYFGYPGARYQVEVYDPSPQQARSLVLAGAIVPIR
jgi:hypothetical protein